MFFESQLLGPIEGVNIIDLFVDQILDDLLGMLFDGDDIGQFLDILL